MGLSILKESLICVLKKKKKKPIIDKKDILCHDNFQSFHFQIGLRQLSFFFFWITKSWSVQLVDNYGEQLLVRDYLLSSIIYTVQSKKI